jgi:hypothetical protein
VEVGDGRLGYFRRDEIDKQLLPRKRLLQYAAASLLKAIGPSRPKPMVDGQTYDRRMVEHAAWWRSVREGAAMAVPVCSSLQNTPGFPGKLLTAELGILRRAKLAAWYLRIGSKQGITGGVPPEVYRERFWAVIRAVDEELAGGRGALEDEFMDFVLELYYLRSAEVMSFHIVRDWNKLSVGEAVGASANFPPVFPPFRELGFYDDLSVAILGLTDGGAYDNMGITALLDEDCTHIISSDTGGLFDVQRRVSVGRLGMSARIAEILMDDAAGLQRQSLRDHRKLTDALSGASDGRLDQLKNEYDLRGLAYFRINSLPVQWPGLPINTDSNLLVRIRTDLDAFGDVEIAALVNQGYFAADEFIRKYLAVPPYDKKNWTKADTPPLPWGVNAMWAAKIFVVGSSRFGRALRLRAPVSVVGSGGFDAW